MKKKQNCEVENCIPSPSSCLEWNGGDMEYLEICDGDKLNNVVWEIVDKLKDIAGEDISSFDIDSLLDICNTKAPLEITLISILNLLKANQICLKDYIDVLNEKIDELSQQQGISVNLKCFADFDNLGNALSITRESLDQLVIDNLCSQENRIDVLEGKYITLKAEVDAIDPTANVDELSIATCINAAVLPTSTQVINVASELCDLEDTLGDATDLASSMSKVPSDLNAEFGLIAGWVLVPANFAEQYGNLILEVENIRQRLKFMETNCCSASCEDVKLGFSAIYNEDGDGIIIKFTSGSGTNIPSGFTDQGSTGTITDIDGNVETFTLTITNNYQTEVSIAGLNTSDTLEVDITAIMGTEILTCEKCLHRSVKAASVCCVVTNNGSTNAVIIYEVDTTNT